MTLKIINNLLLIFRNPVLFYSKFKRKLHKNHNDFYYNLMDKKLVKYDKRNKTYIRYFENYKFHLIPNDKGISRILARDGIREAESVDALFKYVTPNMTIFDLGANIGFYVLLEVQIISKGQGKIFALEPVPENFRILNLNVETNDYRKYVSVHHGAICDHTGEVKLELYPRSNSARLAGIMPPVGSTGVINVPCYRFVDFLDKVNLNFDQLDFLRMDIEGSEYDVLFDILDLLAKKDSFLMFIEFHPHSNIDKHKIVLKELENIGFVSLDVTKEYVFDGEVKRVHKPHTKIKQLYEDDFFLQFGGCEVFLQKG